VSACTCACTCVCACMCTYACMNAMCLLARTHACVCLCLYVCVSVCVFSIMCSQESDPRHGLCLKTSGVCSCSFGSGAFGFNTIMFQTSTYMSLFMRICMRVCSSTCLHRCMFMSRTHNTHMHATHIHAHTTHRPHHNEFSTLLFFHQYLSQSCAETSELLRRISTSELDPQSFCFVQGCFVLLCMCACMYPCVLSVSWSVICCPDCCLMAFATGALPEE